jgi:shikimate kinase
MSEMDSSLRLPIERLVLTGFMGSGKSTVGRLLAARLGWRFKDLDDEIERSEGRSIAEIFAESSEAVFRHLETETLQSTLCDCQVVLALGGGAIETPANRELLAASERTLVVLLVAPFAVLYDRCLRQNSSPESAVRPLLGNPESAAERLESRNGLYKATAHLVVDTSGDIPEESTEKVLKVLNTL